MSRPVKTALIMMTILGCDDTASQCNFVQTLPQRWTSIELCDVASEREMARLQKIDYPVVVAVCQTPESALENSDDVAEPAADAMTSPEVSTGLAVRALERVKGVLPSVEGLRELAGKPIRLMTDSYSWVARKVAD